MADLIPLSDAVVGTVYTEVLVQLSDAVVGTVYTDILVPPSNSSFGFADYIAYNSPFTNADVGSVYSNLRPISLPSAYGFATTYIDTSASVETGSLLVNGYDVSTTILNPIYSSIGVGNLTIRGLDISTTMVAPFVCSTGGNFSHFSRKKDTTYFNYRDNYSNERNLFDIWSTEAYNNHGVCMEYYVASYDKKYDPIWGEDGDRRFTRFFDIMVMYNLPTEDKMWSKFGIEGTDEITMWATKRHFRTASNNPITKDEYIPQIGDVIRANYNNDFYEIVEVAEQTSMFLQSKQHIWEFIVKPFKDEGIGLTDDTSSTPISAFTDKDEDIFDVSNVVDVDKEDILYKPKDAEQGNKNPFGNW